MKLIASLAIAGALLAALLFVPIGGRTLWQRGQAKGLPQSAARALSSGAHAALGGVHRAWSWAREKGERSAPPDGLPSAKKSLVRRDSPRAGSERAAEQFAQGHYRNTESAGERAAREGRDAATPDELRAMDGVQAAPLAPAMPGAPAPAAPGSPAHDRIVATPSREKLSDGDRAGLQKLIAGAR